MSFGYPATLLRSYDHWHVLLREKQLTAGSLVLWCHEDATTFADISARAAAELRTVWRDVEAVLRAGLGADRVNYLALMMVDPEVHFHVFPRYAEPRLLAGVEWVDQDWPRPPTLAAARAPESATWEALYADLARRFAGTGAPSTRRRAGGVSDDAGGG